MSPGTLNKSLAPSPSSPGPVLLSHINNSRKCPEWTIPSRPSCHLRRVAQCYATRGQEGVSKAPSCGHLGCDPLEHLGQQRHWQTRTAAMQPWCPTWWPGSANWGIKSILYTRLKVWEMMLLASGIVNLNWGYLVLSDINFDIYRSAFLYLFCHEVRWGWHYCWQGSPGCLPGYEASICYVWITSKVVDDRTRVVVGVADSNSIRQQVPKQMRDDVIYVGKGNYLNLLFLMQVTSSLISCRVYDSNWPLGTGKLGGQVG